MPKLTVNKKRMIWVGVAALALIAVFFFGWWMKPVVVVHQQTEIDSLRTAFHYDSLQFAADIVEAQARGDALAAEILLLDEQIRANDTAQVKKAEEIMRLPADESVALFEGTTGADIEVIELDGDTGAIVPLPVIRLANVLFGQHLACISSNSLLKAKVDTYEKAVEQKDELIALTYSRITQVTGAYNQSQIIINRQQKYITKYAKKVRRRNIVIGVLGGIALGAIGVAILVD